MTVSLLVIGPRSISRNWVPHHIVTTYAAYDMPDMSLCEYK